MPTIDNTFEASIANGDTDSAVIDMKGHTLCGIFMPAAFTGTSVKILASATAEGTFVPVTDGAGTDYAVTVAASKYVPVDFNKLMGVRFIKIKSGSSEGADRILGLAGRFF